MSSRRTREEVQEEREQLKAEQRKKVKRELDQYWEREWEREFLAWCLSPSSANGQAGNKCEVANKRCGVSI